VEKDGATVATASSSLSSSSLALNNVTTANAGSYTVTISNSVGSVTSSAAVVTVNAPATTFTQRRFTSGSNKNLWGFAYGNGTLVAVGSPGLLYSSADGATWVQRASGTNEWLVGVAYGDSRLSPWATMGESSARRTASFGRMRPTRAPFSD
jgi:hypothetical protein